MQPPPPPPESGHRRAAAAPQRSVGCMSGLLRLLSPYHRSHHRKRLTVTSGAKSTSTPSALPASKKKSPTSSPQPPPQELRRRRSCEAPHAPRSPTIAPEHRRASCSAAGGGASLDSPRPPPPAIVARLMGLEESAPPSPAVTPPPPPQPEAAGEKRRKLLGALEKCDEDLKTLRRIIAAVRTAEMRAAAASDGAELRTSERVKWMDGGDEQQKQYPSPDSVLDAISSPRFPCKKRSSPCTTLVAERKGAHGFVAAVGTKIVKPSPTAVFLGDSGKKAREISNARHVMHQPVVAMGSSIPRACKWMRWEKGGREWQLRGGRSRAMVASVGEVWEEGVGEERWEFARVGVALEFAILRDLVEETIVELSAQCGRRLLVPHAVCRKRLYF